jgi:hypothetical protein
MKIKRFQELFENLSYIQAYYPEIYDTVMRSFSYDINQGIVGIADSYGWEDDDQWMEDLESEQDWFDNYQYFAEDDLIEDIQQNMKNFIEEQFGKISFDWDQMNELARAWYEQNS